MTGVPVHGLEVQDQALTASGSLLRGRPSGRSDGGQHRLSDIVRGRAAAKVRRPALAGGELIAGYRKVVETGEPLVVPVLPYDDVIDGQYRVLDVIGKGGFSRV